MFVTTRSIFTSTTQGESLTDQMNFSIKTDETGRASLVSMNGEDITDFVRGITVVAASNEMTIVGIEFVRARVEVSGPAMLQQLVANTGTTAAQAVMNLDWNQVESEALEELGMGESITQALMSKVVEKLNGTEP